MISLEPSILVRYVTRDHARLSPLALEIITNNACFVSKAALMEMVFTLESVYRKSRDEIATALKTIIGLTRSRSKRGVPPDTQSHGMPRGWISVTR